MSRDAPSARSPLGSVRIVRRRSSPMGGSNSGRHGRRRNTLQTVGAQGYRSKTPQTACAGTTAKASPARAAPAAKAAVPNGPASPRMAIASFARVGGDLHVDHAIGIADRPVLRLRALLELVDDLHA